MLTCSGPCPTRSAASNRPSALVRAGRNAGEMPYEPRACHTAREQIPLRVSEALYRGRQVEDKTVVPACRPKHLGVVRDVKLLLNTHRPA
jgi:hypothetical protein